MRTLLALLVAASAWGQQSTPPATSAPATPAAQSAPAAPSTPAAAPEESPAPAGEDWIKGSIEVGYRWTEIGGSLPSYRSIVDLGEGPKLIGLDFTIADPKHRLFDRLSVRANSWGGDPYNTAHLDAEKRHWYVLTADYRNIAYFNALPSFANPFAPAGFNEQSFDTHRRTGYVNLLFFPSGHIKPYAAYERNSGYGHGIATWTQDGNNEFAVPTLLNDGTNSYRAGVRFEYQRYHATFEMGGTTFKEDDAAGYNGVNNGNRTTPLLGNKLYLNTLDQSYAIRGNSLYSKVIASADPTSWLSLSGQFLWSEPKTDARYFDSATGNFALLSSLLFYPGEFSSGTSNANAPHILANAGFEIRPLKNLRIVESWTTNRYHEAGFGALAEQILLVPSTVPSMLTALNTRQVVNENQEEIEAIFDPIKQVTLRGGYRYVWGDATVRSGQLSFTGPFENGSLRRNVALAGATVRPLQKLSLHVDYEGGFTGASYFRTGLYNYNRARAGANYQATGSILLQANFSIFDNQNPDPQISYDFRARDNSLAVYWSPKDGKRVTVMAEYDCSSLRSKIAYLLLPTYAPAVSLYRENGHTGTMAVDVTLPPVGGIAAKLTAGGSLFLGSGTRPTQYYQPLARLSVPFYKHIQWNSEWRWYGFGESYYGYEAFTAHTIMTGLRYEK
jgi:hypothetical protein